MHSAFESQTLASNGLLPLPLSRTLFEQVAREFSISSVYLSVLNTGMATYISPSTKSDSTEWQHARKLIKKCYCVIEWYNWGSRICYSAKRIVFKLFHDRDIQYWNWQNLHLDIRCTVLVAIGAVYILGFSINPTIWADVCSDSNYGASGQVV